MNPEAVLCAKRLALAACAADCVSATVNLPVDEMFWCAGCQGSMYPMNGNVSASIGHVQASRLVLSRFAYKLHRELRSEERRVGKECVSTCRSGWFPYH